MGKNAGTLRFGEIERLPEQWWLGSGDQVWQVWDRQTYYLWGANRFNYDLASGAPLNGGGMAGPNGPTRGVAHSHYIGLDTMEPSEMRNRAVFEKLGSWIESGNDVVVPTFRCKFSLGTGIAASQPDWVKIQTLLFEGLVDLADRASAFEAPAGTFWPDCRTRVSISISGREGREGGAEEAREVSICDRAFASRLDHSTPGSQPIRQRRDLEAILRILSSVGS